MKAQIQNLQSFLKKLQQKIKSLDSKIVPFTEEETRHEGRGFYYRNETFIHHSTVPIEETAFFRLSLEQVILIDCLLCMFLIGILINMHQTIVLLFAFLITFYFSDLLFQLLLVFRGFKKNTEITISDEDLKIASNKDWPFYTILCPLYKEWKIVSQFVIAMSDLDYPKNKLQILLLLEEDDSETIQKIQDFHLPYYFQILIIPHSQPKTKPKALNYGLQSAKGEFIVVYDAEDIPEKDQLQKSVLAFEKCSEQIVCMQAKLHFYNPKQNLLTKLFTAEYSLWFDLVLTGLHSIHGPIPLGGTSNHFRKSSLITLQGWDSFNVTEDCDLGIRLTKMGKQTAMINSTTFEEANSKAGNWIKQRSRWIKGYIQTYFVHTRTLSFRAKRSAVEESHTTQADRKGYLFDLLGGMRSLHAFVLQCRTTLGRDDKMKTNQISTFLIFQLIVGGKVTSLFINPIMWILTILYFTFRHTTGTIISSFFPTPILYLGTVCLIFGNFLYAYYYMMGAAKREAYGLIKYVFLIPFYWLAMSFAAWIALGSIIFKPYYWAKTNHGYHLNRKSVEEDVQIFEPEQEQWAHSPAANSYLNSYDT